MSNGSSTAAVAAREEEPSFRCQICERLTVGEPAEYRSRTDGRAGRAGADGGSRRA